MFVPKKIHMIAEELGLEDDEYYPYGHYIGKVNWQVIERLKNRPKAKLILVTAMTPTASGEGKTTTTIGLGDAIYKLGKKVMICLREPSLGPIFGLKGGAVGGGKAKLFPELDINLHFTGDIHAVSSAHNLLAAMIDNHIYQGNELRIDPLQVFWKRCIDMNDRQLRFIITGLGGKSNGIPREDGFEITAASEVMAILSLAKDLKDLRERLANIIIGINDKGLPVFSRELKVHNAMTMLLKDALSPNLVQTLEGTPTFVHGGPFANIAHGCSSIIATTIASSMSDYVVTEAGFGSDLGGEKFFDIKCRIGGFQPSVGVLVASVKAIKLHGEGKSKDIEILDEGLKNLFHHIHILRDIFKVPVVVAINRFLTDTDRELNLIEKMIRDAGVRVAISEVYEKGAEGGIQLAKEVIEAISVDENSFSYLYSLDEPYEEKIDKIAKEVYGAKEVKFTNEAKQELNKVYKWGIEGLPVCMAKTQYSLSENAKMLGKPDDFSITVQKIKPSLGAGFLVAYTGNIITMPGLPKVPLATKIEIDEAGNVTGLV
ncbi:MAG: formate--tetrahydrofolate ligase [bacterium]